VVREPTPCVCANYVDNDNGAGTGCGSVSRSKFAPGHDAKLKSFLIRCGADGHQVRQADNGQVESSLAWAKLFGFAEQVRSGIDRAVAKNQARKLLAMGTIRSALRTAPDHDLASTVAKEERTWADTERRRVADREASADW
jgi:hypothetical protein